MARFIFFIIVIYIIAKIIGVVLRFVRRLMNPGGFQQKPTSRNTAGKKPVPYSNVEDVEYEDITDKK